MFIFETSGRDRFLVVCLVRCANVVGATSSEGFLAFRSSISASLPYANGISTTTAVG